MFASAAAYVCFDMLVVVNWPPNSLRTRPLYRYTGHGKTTIASVLFRKRPPFRGFIGIRYNDFGGMSHCPPVWRLSSRYFCYCDHSCYRQICLVFPLLPCACFAKSGCVCEWCATPTAAAATAAAVKNSGGISRPIGPAFQAFICVMLLGILLGYLRRHCYCRGRSSC